MGDGDTQEQLREEVHRLRQRVAALEASEAEHARRTREHEAVLRSMIQYFPFDFWARRLSGECFLQSKCSVGYWGRGEGVRADEMSVDSQTRRQWEDTNARVLRGEVVQGETKFVTLDGVVRDFHQIVVPMRDGDEIAGFVGVNIDITEPKRIREELAASEARYRSLVESSQDAIFQLDAEGRFLFVNTAGARIMGWQPAEFAGKGLRDVFPPEIAEELLGLLRHVAETGQPVTSDRILPTPGELAVYSTIVAPVLDRDGQVESVVGIARNVTAQRRADEQLQAQHRLALALSNDSGLEEALQHCLETAIHIAGMDSGGVFLVNEVGGLELATYRGVSREFAESVGRLEADSPQAQAVRSGTPKYRQALEATRSIGGPSAFAMLPAMHEGRAVACLAVGSRTLDEVPRAVREPLEAIAAQVGGAIVRLQAQEELARRERALRQLLDVYEKHRQLIAYEIHDGVAQPLTAALMNLEGTLRRLDGESQRSTEAGFSRVLQLVRQSIEESRRLMRGLRPLILDEAGLLPALEALTYEVASDELSIDYSADVNFDRLASPLETAVFRIVQEGLANARRHSKSPQVRVALRQQGERLCVEIEDHGVGFDPDTVAVKRFGLQGIRERARLFGGHSSIRSSPGRGCLIRVELPIVEAVADATDLGIS
jgi:PAS domain S-box-containing protein